MFSNIARRRRTILQDLPVSLRRMRSLLPAQALVWSEREKKRTYRLGEEL